MELAGAGFLTTEDVEVPAVNRRQLSDHLRVGHRGAVGIGTIERGSRFGPRTTGLVLRIATAVAAATVLPGAVWAVGTVLSLT